MPTKLATSVTEKPGIHRFIVGSAAEAVAVIQAELGPDARVLSVNNQAQGLLKRTFGAPRFEVIAELPEPKPSTLLSVGDTKPVLDAPGREREDASSFDPIDLLRRAGFPEKLLARLEFDLPVQPGNSVASHRWLVDLGDHLRLLCAVAPRSVPQRLAFMGQAGVGRTTALSQWLAHETLLEKRTGTIWKVEFSQPNPTARLDVIAEAMGVPMEHYLPGLSEAETGDAQLWVDLPALPAAGTPNWQEYADFLETEQIEGRVLVLNALYAPAALRSAFARGCEMGATHLVFTHMDEAEQCGHLWEFLIDGELIPLFASCGAGLMGDLATDVVECLIQRTLPGLQGGRA